MPTPAMNPHPSLSEPGPGLVWMIHKEVQVPVALPPSWLERDDYSAIPSAPTSPAVDAASPSDKE